MIELVNRKNTWRSSVLAARKNLSPAQVADYSEKIARRLETLEPIKEARTVMGFFPINNEACLLTFLNNCLLDRRRVLLPRMEGDGNIIAVEFTGWEQTSTGKFGIREPLGTEFAVGDIDVVLVPGLVFDKHGYRLGYGKGYYDRFLARPGIKAFKCGICYEFQLVEDVFPHQNDIPVNRIITEESELVIG
ncbi:MAG: 5-formyltetrahydrofolate cyclo-ligase [Syntrophomonas sp.]